jgi:hypothetical protein
MMHRLTLGPHTAPAHKEGTMSARAERGHDDVQRRRRPTVVVIAVLITIVTGGCAGGLPGSSTKVACPSPIETPVLYPGDTWTFRYNDGRRWRQAYDAVTVDGLLRGRGPVARAAYYFDHTHTLRKVYVDGTWLTWDTPDFPEIGQPELEFPLTVGKSWPTRWYRYASTQITQDSWVAGCEQVTVPAGTFVAARIEVSRREAQGASAALRRYTLWYAPAVKYWVRGMGGAATLADPFVDFELESFTIDAGKPATK